MPIFRRRKRKAKELPPKAWSLTPPPLPSQDLSNKAEAINLLLLSPNVNLWKLREYALTEGGLVNDSLRKRAWPKLVGLHPYKKNRNERQSLSSLQQTTTQSLSSPEPRFEIDASVLKETEKRQAKRKE